MHGVAYSYQALGRHDEAAKLFQETVDLRTAELGRDNADTLWSMHNLAISLAALGRFTEALKLDEETLQRRKARLGPNHADTLASMNSLAATYFDLGRYEEALALHKDAWARRQAVSGPDAPDTLDSKVNVANSYRALQRYAEAIKLYEEALAVLKARQPDHSSTMNCMGGLALSYTALNRHADALKLRLEVLKLCKDRFGPDHPATLGEIAVVAESLMRLDRGAEAVTLIDEVVRRAPETKVHPRFLGSLIDRRLRHFETSKDASGCRATAEMWERLNHTAPESLYNAACLRAVTAAVVKLDPKTPPADAARLAQEQADRAMAWLHKAVAAGFRNAAHMKQDKDLDALREREDFKKLIAGLEATTPPSAVK